MARKATTTIAKNHGVVVIENLRVKELTKTSRSSVESLGRLVEKTANRNRALLEIAPRTIRTWSTSADGAAQSSSSSVPSIPRRLQRVRRVRCGKSHQPRPFRLHRLPQDARRRRQRSAEHP